METPLTPPAPMTNVPSTDPGALVTTVLLGSARLGTTRLICIDGPAGSGKTTLAAQLAAEAVARGVGTSVVHMDDVYDGWAGLSTGIANVGHWLLEPLAANRPGGYHRFDWAAERYAEWHVVAPGGLLLLEGVGAAAAQVDGRATLRIWVELPLAERTERWRARDQGAADPFVADWQAREDAHFRSDHTAERADVSWWPATH